MARGDLPDLDPRGLIWEAYRIEGITGPDCRTIFFDWAMGLDASLDAQDVVKAVLAHYGPKHPGQAWRTLNIFRFKTYLVPIRLREMFRLNSRSAFL